VIINIVSFCFDITWWKSSNFILSFPHCVQ
jgi:hypothetical protein